MLTPGSKKRFRPKQKMSNNKKRKEKRKRNLQWKGYGRNQARSQVKGKKKFISKGRPIILLSQEAFFRDTKIKGTKEKQHKTVVVWERGRGKKGEKHF